MTICSTSLSRCILASALALPVNSLFPANMSQGRPASGSFVSSRIVASWPIQSSVRPHWASFSPADSRLILVDAGGEGLLLSPNPNAVRRLNKSLLPVGWLGDTVVARDESGAFRLLDGPTLTSASHLPTGTVRLPESFGRNRLLRFEIALPQTATNAIRPARELGFEIGKDPEGNTVRDTGGRTIFRGSQKIYGITLSPDTYKLIVYYGNRDYVVFNRLTGAVTPLPSSIHAWHWMPDNSTLIGEVSLGGSPDREQVTATELYLRREQSAALQRLTLPPEIRGAALRILDVSSDGKVLVDAERVKGEAAYLGVAVLELDWP